MGYAFCVGSCALCSLAMTFNPHKVPSINTDGVKRPVCADCVRQMQNIQRRKGYTPWPDPLPGAYQPLPEDEL